MSAPNINSKARAPAQQLDAFSANPAMSAAHNKSEIFTPTPGPSSPLSKPASLFTNTPTSPTTFLTSILPIPRVLPPSCPQLDLRTPDPSLVSTLTQTLTSANGIIYITHVTLGGEYHPTDVPPASRQSEGHHLTNAQLGAIIGGVSGLLIVTAVIWWMCVRARQHAQYVAWWYRNYGNEYGSSSSSSEDNSSDGGGRGGGRRAKGSHIRNMHGSQSQKEHNIKFKNGREGMGLKVGRRRGGASISHIGRPDQPGPEGSSRPPVPPPQVFQPNATLNVQTAEWDPRNPARTRGARYAADFSKKGAWGR